MNRKDISESEKQQQTPSAKRQSFLEEFGKAPLAFIMKNPKVTPKILLVLGAAPLVITAVVLALFFLWQKEPW
jgi:hypothetical protein